MDGEKHFRRSTVKFSNEYDANFVRYISHLIG